MESTTPKLKPEQQPQSPEQKIEPEATLSAEDRELRQLWWDKVLAHVPPLPNQKIADAPSYE